jgi:hypothetical protein
MRSKVGVRLAGSIIFLPVLLYLFASTSKLIKSQSFIGDTIVVVTIGLLAFITYYWKVLHLFGRHFSSN